MISRGHSPTFTRASRTLALTVTMLVLACLTAVSAQAGTYDIFSCHQAASSQVASINGWLGSSTGGYVSAVADCTSSGGAMSGSLFNGVDHAGGDMASWRFTAPADTRIVQLQVQRHVDAGTSQAYGTPQYLLLADDSTALEGCNQFTGCSSLDGTADFAVNSATSLNFQAVCSGFNGCPARSGPTVNFAITRARIRLRDDSSPSVSSVSGDLATADTVSGTSSVAFNAADKGGGLYRARIYVDGQVVRDQLVDDNSGLCVEPFTQTVPCKLQTSGSAQLDTTKFDDGRVLTVKVDVTDAAGNATTVLSDHRVTVDNTPPCLRPAAKANGLFLGGVACNPLLRKNSNDPNGQGATLSAGLQAHFLHFVSTPCATKAQRRARRICHRAAAVSRIRVSSSAKPLITGRLLNTGGTPIAGAVIWLAKTTEGQGPRMFASISTAANGSFHAQLPAKQPNGVIKAYYFPSSGSNENVASGDLALHVRAGVYLAAKAHGGRRITFAGRVTNQSAGNGLIVALQVRQAGRWHTFRQTRARGVPARFTASYRFVDKPSARRYTFRAVVIRQTGFPYDSGSSRAAIIKVR